MVKVSQLLSKRIKAEVEYEGEKVHFTYRPFSDELEEEALALTNGEYSNKTASALVSKLVLDWDVEGDDGEPLPLTVEALRPLPTAFKMAIVLRVMEEMRPSGNPR